MHPTSTHPFDGIGDDSSTDEALRRLTDLPTSSVSPLEGNALQFWRQSFHGRSDRLFAMLCALPGASTIRLNYEMAPSDTLPSASSPLSTRTPASVLRGTAPCPQCGIGFDDAAVCFHHQLAYHVPVDVPEQTRPAPYKAFWNFSFLTPSPLPFALSMEAVVDVLAQPSE